VAVFPMSELIGDAKPLGVGTPAMRPDPRSMISQAGWGAEPEDRLASKRSEAGNGGA
jgi:hypothetical protein